MLTVQKNTSEKSSRGLLVRAAHFILFMLTLLSNYLPAQDAQPVSMFEITAITFEGNTTFDDEQLEEVIRTKETPGAVSKFFYSVFGEKLGSKPEYLDEIFLEEDKEQLILFYKHHSFFSTTINIQTTLDTVDESCSLVFNVSEGNRSFIDSLEYLGIDSIASDLKEQITFEPIITKGMAYEPPKAQSEIARILNILAENGYPQARFDKERSGAIHRASTNNFLLTISIVPGKRYAFGDVTVHVEPAREDIAPELIIRQLDFEQGELYSKRKTISSERSLNRLDLFESVRIDHPRFSDTLQSTLIPSDIFVRPRDRHEISPELSVSDENNTFNLGLGLGYTNRNFLGDARLFSIRARVRAQSLLEWNLGDVVLKGNGLSDESVIGAVELQFQIQQPYFFSKRLNGSWTSSIISEKQIEYKQSILRNKIGLSNQFAIYTYGLAEWTLERVSPEFEDSTKIPLIFTLQENQKQFNSILTLTLQRDKTNDIFSPTEGFFNSITVEESGILPKVLPSIKGDLPFTQYYKLILFGRWYDDLTTSKFNILAMKGRAGYQDKYGDSYSSGVNIPLNRRFFAGGSGSVRGWRARDLGAMPDSLLPLGGNFIFEGNLELRINHLRGFGKALWFDLDNVWGVYYLDFGNVWSDLKDFTLKDLAVAAGIGFRYETLFGPFRIDYGFRIYDPKEPAGHQTIFQKRFWGDVFSNGVLHFGIGHAF
ncbi:MAG: BamA/TamA family outer membrane protein [Ignavibacteriae bacterium]|nr:BamA/TamA family outer membrane protein [Ignavibacteriota bacterium]